MIRTSFFCSGALATLLALPLAFAQQRPERTLDEIKTEAIHRAENGMYPLSGLDPVDVKEAFASIKTRDPDEWAEAFMGVADRYATEARSLESSDPAKANADYIRAWRIYSFGRWPIPVSPGKKKSYARALEAFRGHRNRGLLAVAEKRERSGSASDRCERTRQQKRRSIGKFRSDPSVRYWVSRG